jgi:hypothetical protein
MRASDSFDPGLLDRVETIELGDGESTHAVPALGMSWLAVAVGLPGRDDPLAGIDPEDPAAWAAIPASLHLMREATSQAVALPLGVRPYLDAPNIHALELLTSSADAVPMGELTLDIVHRSYGLAPVATVSPVGPPGIVAGVVSHVAERVMTDPTPGASSTVPVEPTVSVGRIFELARDAGIGARVFSGPDLPADADYPSDAVAALRSALGAGWVAIVPDAAIDVDGHPRVGWWLVDPLTGRTLDQLDDGRGAGEYPGTLTVAERARLVFVKMGCVMSGMMILAGGAVYVLGQIPGASVPLPWPAGYVGAGAGAAATAGAFGIIACLAS